MSYASHFSSASRYILPRSTHVCLQCRLRAITAVRTTKPSISLPYACRRYASWLDTNKLRKRLWKGTPPGQEDPYRRESDFEKRSREMVEQREEEGELEMESEEELDSGPEGEVDDHKRTTAEGLETVGGPGWGTKEWKAENRFQGFMESKRTEDRNGIILAVHRALVEIYALKEAGLPLATDYYSKDPTEDYAERVAEGAKFEQDMNGQMVLVLESEELRHLILKCVTPQERDSSAMEETEVEDDEESTEEEVESVGTEEMPSQSIKEDDDINSEREGCEVPVPHEEPLETAEPSSSLAALVPASDTWATVSLEDAAIKFAALKRVMKLTGRRIPDPDISAITTPKSLLVHLVKKPKPKRVAEVLVNFNPVVKLPNVQIQDRRYGPIDREIEIGRWKVIKGELKKRGLPITSRATLRNTIREEGQ